MRAHLLKTWLAAPGVRVGYVVAKTDDESTTSVAVERLSGAMAESMRYKMFAISARDSSHQNTPPGVKVLSFATAEKAAEPGISRTFYANVR